MYGRLSDSNFGNQLLLTYLAPYFIGFTLSFYISFLLSGKKTLKQRLTLSLIIAIIFSFVIRWFIWNIVYTFDNQQGFYENIFTYVFPPAIIFIILSHFFLSRYISRKR